VSEKGAAEPKWELFDLQSDYSESKDVSDQHPAMVKELSNAFDQFWRESLSGMINEQAVGPTINPFQERYFREFGGSPSAEDMARMAPKN
jgi:arylsulfatase